MTVNLYRGIRKKQQVRNEAAEKVNPWEMRWEHSPFFIHAIRNSGSNNKKKNGAEGNTGTAMAFARGLPVCAFSSELAFLKLKANKRGYLEASSFLYTGSIAIISKELMSSCTLLQFGFEKAILCFQTQKEGR